MNNREPRWTLAALAADNDADFLAAIMPGGIERQEAQGQAKLVASAMLPKEMDGITRPELEALGFIFGTDADELFVNVQMPDGWRKEATDHSLWSDLRDDEGRKRASVGYKAAFYDRWAMLNWIPDANVISKHDEDAGTQLGIILKSNDADKLEQAHNVWLTMNVTREKAGWLAYYAGASKEAVQAAFDLDTTLKW